MRSGGTQRSDGVAAWLSRVVGQVRPHAVTLIVVVTLGLRLPLLSHPLTPDEGGFLAVGAQWHAGGTSLYGNYWVDRPPLLITIFRWAAQAGGVVPLRLIGALAAALTVLGVAHVARRLGGDSAARWAALAAGAWSVNPLLGTDAINGELLSAPFVIWAIAIIIGSVGDRQGRRAWRCAAGAGAAAVAALLIKQNIADGAVFAAAIGVIAWRRGELSTRQVRRLGSAFALGGVAFLAVMSAWTLSHGTSLAGVYNAMYPFRIQAGHILASSPNPAPARRFWGLMTSWLLSGGAVSMVIVIWALARRSLTGTAVWALTVTLGFEMVSVVMGGNYWNHYLIQLLGPLSVLVGVLVLGHRRSVTVLLSAVAVLAGAAWVIALPLEATSVSSSVGRSLQASARPGDTIITVYGHAALTEASGMVSPYPYLWSLPAKTLDPDLHLLNDVLRGPTAPTWFVTWSHVSSWGVHSRTTARLIARDYRPVAVLHGRTIYLHNGLSRPTPMLNGEQPSTTPPAPPFEELFQ